MKSLTAEPIEVDSQINIEETATNKKMQIEKRQRPKSELKLTTCPSCGEPVEWNCESWDLDKKGDLLWFGYYVCECGYKSELSLRHFRVPEKEKRWYQLRKHIENELFK